MAAVLKPRVALFAAGLAMVLVAGVSGSCSTRSTTSGGGPVYADSAGERRPEPLHFAVHPLHNPATLARDYQPLMDYLNARLGGPELVLEASRDYAAFEDKVRARAPEFLLPNPWQALLALRSGYVVLASAGEPRDFKGIFLVRRDGPVRTVADLRGRRLAYPAPTALAACVMPQWYLHEHGIDATRDVDNAYVGSQESAILSASMGQADAGVTWPPPWRAFQREHPDAAATLRVLCETEPLVNNAIMARDDVPVALRDSVRALLVSMDRDDAGRAVLAGMETARILPATAATYEPVRRFVARFVAEVRPVAPEAPR